MELNPLQQSVEFLNRSKNVLICLPVNPSSDAIASGLALFLTFERLGKRSKVVCSKFQLPDNHSFLPKSDAIEKELANLRQFVISLDISKVAVDELSYSITDGKLNVYITPKNGFYEARDVTTSAGNFSYDAIIAIDAVDLDLLGDLVVNNAEFFYRTPVLNIDHRPQNMHFGNVNLVDITATSTSEIVFELVKALGFNVLDEQVATTLLTGIISKTKSFQSPSVTPRSLAIASHLVASGARREEIIDNLYQSKSIAALKLWGRALARLHQKRDGRLIWTLLGEQDFKQSGANEEDLPQVIDELIVNVPSAELIIIVYGREGRGITAIVSTTKSHDLKTLFPQGKPYGGQNFLIWSTQFPDLASAETQILRTAETLFQ